MSESNKVVLLRVNPEYEKIWGPLPKPEFEALKQSIQLDGLLDKIKINRDHIILDGHNRYRALRELSLPLTEDMVEIVDVEDEILYLIRTQINRRHATPYHKVENALPLYEIETKRAQRRMLRGDPREKFPEGMTGRAREAIADMVGFSDRTVEKALYIVKYGACKPGLKEKLRRGTKPSIDAAYRQVREIIEPKPTPVLPKGEFNVVYADPPWHYDFRLRGSADDHYPTMTTKDICELEVPFAENAILFLWATNPKIEDAFKVIEAWGFTYKTNMAWVKDKWGTGYYFRGQHELLLVAVKGEFSPPPSHLRRSSVLEAPRTEHSRKPREVYDIIESMYPDHDYLELFSRGMREGWTMWGHDAS